MVRCAQCGEDHDIFSIQPRFRHPDAYAEVPAHERAIRTATGSDWCRIRAHEGDIGRFFLRVVLPVRVRGEARDVCWSVWIEVEESVYRRVQDLWADAAQSEEPPLPGVMANALPGYPPTLGLPGRFQLVGPQEAPRFALAPGLDHPLAAEQRDGVYPERALEWVAGLLH
ncbi:MAG TPA: DUF2199 domain-containing protein [Gemmatimonadales bacterium]|nr:DUF2199 domain-containing protein [Gemmatimonadales bacterium]